MKTKKKCEICSKRFEAVRSDAKYCSNACKQKAHTLRNKIGSERYNDKIVFYLDEYQNVCSRCGYDSETFPLIFFCFLRKNLIVDATIETVIIFINAIWTYSNFKELTTSKAYKSFLEEFLDNEISVIQVKNNQIDNNPKLNARI